MDVSELGCLYGSAEFAERNTELFGNALAFVDDICISGELHLAMCDGFLIRRGGVKGNEAAGFHLYGRGDASLVGWECDEPTTPLLRVERIGTPRILIENLSIYSEGSGIHLERAGAATVVRNVRITASGEGSELSQEDWSDVDWDHKPNLPRMLCSYGIWINNSDGGHLDGVTMYDCAGHGLVATRWHDGKAHVGQIHGCHGCGFKGERINGTQIDIRCESNDQYGMFLTRCCERSNAWPAHGYWHPTGSPTKVWAWCENNNGGNRERQVKLDHCDGLLLEGHQVGSS